MRVPSPATGNTALRITAPPRSTPMVGASPVSDARSTQRGAPIAARRVNISYKHHAMTDNAAAAPRITHGPRSLPPAAQQEVLCLIELGREIAGAAMVRVQLGHQARCAALISSTRRRRQPKDRAGRRFVHGAGRVGLLPGSLRLVAGNMAAPVGLPGDPDRSRAAAPRGDHPAGRRRADRAARKGPAKRESGRRTGHVAPRHRARPCCGRAACAGCR